MSDKKIHFTVIENNAKQVLDTYFGEYRDLMSLLRDKLYLDDFGECGGTGRCATCVVKIKVLAGGDLGKEKKESATLLNLGFKEERIRLACQIPVTNNLHDSEIEILDIEQ